MKHTKKCTKKIRESNLKAWDEEKCKTLQGEYNPQSKLSEKDVIEIYKLAKRRESHVSRYGKYAKDGGMNYNDIGEMYNVSKTLVRYILVGRLWWHVTGIKRTYK